MRSCNVVTSRTAFLPNLIDWKREECHAHMSALKSCSPTLSTVSRSAPRCNNISQHVPFASNKRPAQVIYEPAWFHKSIGAIARQPRNSATMLYPAHYPQRNSAGSLSTWLAVHSAPPSMRRHASFWPLPEMARRTNSACPTGCRSHTASSQDGRCQPHRAG